MYQRSAFLVTCVCLKRSFPCPFGHSRTPFCRNFPAFVVLSAFARVDCDFPRFLLHRGETSIRTSSLLSRPLNTVFCSPAHQVLSASSHLSATASPTPSASPPSIKMRFSLIGAAIIGAAVAAPVAQLNGNLDVRIAPHTVHSSMLSNASNRATWAAMEAQTRSEVETLSASVTPS